MMIERDLKMRQVQMVPKLTNKVEVDPPRRAKIQQESMTIKLDAD